MSLNGAESDASSSASEFYVEDENTNVNLENDSEFQEALGKLDQISLDPDKILPEMSADDFDQGSEGDKVSVKSGDSQNEGMCANATAVDEGLQTDTPSKSSLKTKKGMEERDKKNSPLKDGKKGSVFDRLKRLTKFEKKSKSNISQFQDVKVDKLPQCFVAKYLGKVEVKGLYGLHHVRAPVDELVGKVKEDLRTQERVELPLVYLVFSPKGIDIRRHSQNRVEYGVEYGNIPIDFISYGVQDIKFWRVFTFIVVNELSSRSKKAHCHAYICDSAPNARKMALSLGACFQVYRKKLASEGRVHNFKVELRPPDEIADNLDEVDCDA
ncbi:hypothetical protein CHS0354_005013 [Potamilus streckersoni]|uniref:PID domain-containing protein n=1 Tax=Potamilus streckersoni TaxID=2493646 RepID=A0AAE0W128_9BIVA|nr:hypothetical protein CHS0354_005013 [Potamilus streckersoni]